MQRCSGQGRSLQRLALPLARQRHAIARLSDFSARIFPEGALRVVLALPVRDKRFNVGLQARDQLAAANPCRRQQIRPHCIVKPHEHCPRPDLAAAVRHGQSAVLSCKRLGAELPVQGQQHGFLARGAQDEEGQAHPGALGKKGMRRTESGIRTRDPWRVKPMR